MVELMDIKIYCMNIIEVSVNYEFVNNKVPTVFIIYCKYDGLPNFKVS